MGSLTILNAGVDTLHLSAHGALQAGLLAYAQALQAAAREVGEEPVVADEGAPFALAVRPHGWRSYPVWMSSPNIELALGAAPPFPPVFVQAHAAYLHVRGADAALAEITTWLGREVFAAPPRLAVSRLDLYADCQGWVPTLDDFERFRCRGIRRRAYVRPPADQAHTWGRACTGFVFGAGDLRARCYDKGLEMRIRGVRWPVAGWVGWDPQQPVWRVEFQFRRRVLVSLGSWTPAEALAARQALWAYATQWLSLRTPSPDSNRARWPEAPEWAAVRAATLGAPSTPRVRELARAADELRIIRGLVGYASSLAALGAAPGLGAALARTAPGVPTYLHGKGEAFGDIVARKRRRRLEVVADRDTGAWDGEGSGRAGRPRARDGVAPPTHDPSRNRSL